MTSCFCLLNTGIAVMQHHARLKGVYGHAPACMFVKTRVETIVHCLPQSLSSLFFFLRQSLSLNSELADFAKLAFQQAPEILLSTLPQCWGYRQALPYLASYWYKESEFRSSCLCNTLSTESSPQLWAFNQH